MGKVQPKAAPLRNKPFGAGEDEKKKLTGWRGMAIKYYADIVTLFASVLVGGYFYKNTR